MNWTVHVALAATQVLFASLPIAVKFVLPTISPLGILFFRVSGAALAFAAIGALAPAERITNRRDLWELAGLALVGVAMNQLLFLEGTKRTTAINTNVLITTVPVFTLAIALLLGRERASAAKIGGILCAATGALYLIGPDRLSVDRAEALGASLITLAAISYAAYLVLSKRLLQRYQPLTVVSYVFLFGAAMVLPAGIVSLRDLDLAAQPRAAVIGLAYIVVFPSIVTYFLSVWALRRTASSLVAMYVYLQPLLTALAAPLILGEQVTPRAGLASVLIFSGLALATWGEQVAGQLGAAFRPPSEGV